MDEVLLVTARSVLLEQVGRLAAAAGVPLAVAGSPAAAGTAWRASPAVLLGDDAAAAGVPGRRGGVLLLAPTGTADPGLWRTAVGVGADGVALLPEDSAAVTALLERVAEPPGGAGLVVGVVGGCGGAGASVLAAAVARSAPPGRVLLVDADPLGGGLDVLVGAGEEPGLRWQDLLGAPPPVRAAGLRDGLPRGDGGVPVLSWGPGPHAPLEPPAGGAVEAVVEAAARASDLVVLDLPRGAGTAGSGLLWQLDLLVVVVPAHPRAVSAAQALVPTVLGRTGDVRLVVAARPGAPLDPDDVADALSLPLLARTWPDRDVRGALARGDALPRPHGSLARCARSVLAAVGADGPVGGAGAAGAGGAGRRHRA